MNALMLSMEAFKLHRSIPESRSVSHRSKYSEHEIPLPLKSVALQKVGRVKPVRPIISGQEKT
jgi:hypothetical protein